MTFYEKNDAIALKSFFPTVGVRKKYNLQSTKEKTKIENNKNNKKKNEKKTSKPTDEVTLLNTAIWTFLQRGKRRTEE